MILFGRIGKKIENINLGHVVIINIPRYRKILSNLPHNLKFIRIYFHKSANLQFRNDPRQLSKVQFMSRPQPPTYNPPIATELPFEATRNGPPTKDLHIAVMFRERNQ